MPGSLPGFLLRALKAPIPKGSSNMSEDSKRRTGIDPELQRLFDSAFCGHRIHALPPTGRTRVWDPPPDTKQWIDAARSWMDRQKGCKFYFSPATIKPGCQTTTKADMQWSEWL